MKKARRIWEGMTLSESFFFKGTGNGVDKAGKLDQITMSTLSAEQEFSFRVIVKSIRKIHNACNGDSRAQRLNPIFCI